MEWNQYLMPPFTLSSLEYIFLHKDLKGRCIYCMYVCMYQRLCMLSRHYLSGFTQLMYSSLAGVPQVKMTHLQCIMNPEGMGISLQKVWYPNNTVVFYLMHWFNNQLTLNVFQLYNLQIKVNSKKKNLFCSFKSLAVFLPPLYWPLYGEASF